MSHCTTCGACCVSFRVDFSVYEYEEGGGHVPAGLASPITEHTCRMRGTDHSPPRCASLYGKPVKSHLRHLRMAAIALP